MSASANEPTLRATAESPLRSGEPERFNLTEMASATDQVNRRHALGVWLGGIGIAGFWGFLATGFVQAGYSNPDSFVVLTVVFGFAVAVSIVGGLYLRRSTNPVALIVVPNGVSLQYSRGPSWEIGWEDPRLHIVVVDQRAAGKPRVSQFSDFSAWFIGSRWIRGGYVPLTEGAHDRILARARELGLPTTSHGLTYRGRIPFSRGTVAHRIRGPPSR